MTSPGELSLKSVSQTKGQGWVMKAKPQFTGKCRPWVFTPLGLSLGLTVAVSSALVYRLRLHRTSSPSGCFLLVLTSFQRRFLLSFLLLSPECWLFDLLSVQDHAETSLHMLKMCQVFHLSKETHLKPGTK